MLFYITNMFSVKNWWAVDLWLLSLFNKQNHWSVDINCKVGIVLFSDDRSNSAAILYFSFSFRSILVYFCKPAACKCDKEQYNAVCVSGDIKTHNPTHTQANTRIVNPSSHATLSPLVVTYSTQPAHACTLTCRVESLGCCIMHGAQGSQTSGVWAWGPGVRNAVRHMSVQSHHLSADLKHTCPQSHKVQSHTYSSVARQICKHTRWSETCQTKVDVMRCVSWFLILRNGFIHASQPEMVTTRRTFDRFFCVLIFLQLHHM